MKLITDSIESAFERVIYLGHLKTRAIEIAGKEVVAADIDLTGKVRSSMAADVDAVGYMYRSGNQNILSFKTKDEVLCGSRVDRFRNQEIVISEMENGELKTHWDKIYID